MLKFRHVLFATMLLLGLDAIAADFNIDNTCTTCPRRQLDSLNVNDRRPIRVNQVGFRPQDPKKAFVANPVGTTFKVINMESGAEAWSGTLEPLGTAARPGIWINGAFNSITSVYHFGDTAATASSENIFQATFSDLITQGSYAVVVGADTSAVFRVHDKIYNYIFENGLKFFGSNRCGNTESWMHGACHLKDGSKVGHDLSGGWHDCGDHGKYAETEGYAGVVLALTYALWPEKAEDFFGANHNDEYPFKVDGIPDLLWEAKIGADYFFKLYKASLADGLIAKSDMYHSVGTGPGVDHNYWDNPARQDAQPYNRGGPDRPVTAGIGSNVAGMFAASLAYVAWGWELFDPVYADSLLNAAKDIYANIILKRPGTGTTEPCCYDGGGAKEDDEALAAVALLFATGDVTYKNNLISNTAIASGIVNDSGDFAAGHMAKLNNPPSWPMDFQQTNAMAYYSFAKLILKDPATAAKYGFTTAERDDVLSRLTRDLWELARGASNGGTNTPINGIDVLPPYNLMWVSSDWGFNRYNMGAVNMLFMLWDLTGDSRYLGYGIDNLDYNLGRNPWDLSFMMGAGDKNLQHPHNRAANPDGYNAGGFPYEYKCPRGALMGGSHPSKTLKDDWNDYTVTETCIDFSAQLIIPSQMLAKDLPPDHSGPLFSNVQANPIDLSTAIISWETNELAQVTVYVSESAGGTPFDTLNSSGLSKAGSVTVQGLSPNVTYYFYLKGQDIRRNVSTDDNHGEWYSFTMKSNPATISSVRICQVDDQSAKIYWWTPNGAYNGLVRYGTNAALLDQSTIGDKGLPVMFHEVLLTGLTPGTTYYFDVVSGSTTDNKGGSHYSFTTKANAVYLDYTLTIKPVNKNGTPTFYVEIINNEPKPYTGVEVRIYFKTKTLSASAINVQINDKGIFDVGGAYGTMTVTPGTTPIQVAGTDQWYIPITIADEIPVAGRARMEVAFFTNGWNAIPLDELTDSWSFIPHTNPVNFPGIDWAKGRIYKEPDHVEKVNGVPEISYVRDPFISAYYKGTHIFGFPPDFASGNMPVSKRNMNMTFSSPFASPQVSVEQKTFSALFNGTAWTTPIGTMDMLEMNALDISNAMTFPAPARTDTLVFSHSVGNLNYGANRNEFVAWYNSNANASNSYDCACAYQRLMVEVDTLMVPRIKRFLRFDPRDTVEFYQGKRKSVTVQLVDSAGTVQTGQDVSLSLAALLPGFSFWSDANATATISRVSLVNGQAEFYVGYETPITTPVISNLNLTVENGTEAYMYIVQNPLLIASPPPPWPLIDAATMIDTNCDQIPDAMDILISGAFAVGRYEFVKVRFEYEGDTLEVTQKVDISANTIRISFVSPSGAKNTIPKGKVWMMVNVVGIEMKESEAEYYDGIGPIVQSVSILEKADPSAKDSLYVQFSEPVSAPGEWFFQIYDATGNPIAQNPEIRSSKIAKEENNIWVFEIAAPAGGIQPIQEGVKVQLKPDATLKDRNGNGLAGCTFEVLNVSVKRRPVPIVYASISDANGDAIAEKVLVRFERAVDALHQPDSISVVFGFFKPETLTTAKYIWNVERTEAVLDLPTTFALGNTGGTYSGFLDSRQVFNAGQLTQHKGVGADYEAGVVLAEDLVGPIILSAEHGAGNTSDTLLVKMSEPFAEVANTANTIYLLRERGGSVAFVPRTALYTSNKTVVVFLFDPTSNGAVYEGDRIRLDPQVSRYVDAAGNNPEFENPWVTVGGTSSAKIKIKVAMREKVTHGGTEKGYGIYPVKEKEQFRVTVYNQRTRSLDIWQNGKLLYAGVDSTSYHHQGPVMDLDLRIPRGAAMGEAPVWDSVAVKIDCSIFTNLGGFVNRIQESLVLRNADYLDNGNQVRISVEWVSHNDRAPKSKTGRIVGTGVYISKSVVSTLMQADNPTLRPEIRARFDGKKSSHSENWLFGYSRSK